MEILLTLILLTGSIAITFYLYFIHRNNEVHKFLMDLAGHVYYLSLNDSVDKKRWEQLDKVSYKEILFKFWKPLKPEAWWDDLSFLKE